MAFDDLIEQIDIGGPSMVRAAAKNFRDVLVVVDPADYSQVLAALDAPGGASAAFRFDLARKAFGHTAAYDAAIAGTLGTSNRRAATSCGRHRARRRCRPASCSTCRRCAISATARTRTRRPRGTPNGGEGFGAAQVLQGKELSFTNLLDLDSAARIVLEFSEPAATVIKHTNPCGAATGASAADAYVRAREADPLAAFGGIVGLNRPIDVETAQAITSTFIEAVIAPGVLDEAAADPGEEGQHACRRRGLRRRWRAASAPELRSILGAVLVQQRDVVGEGHAWPGADADDLRVVTKRQPTERRVARASVRLAHLRAREVQRRDLHQRQQTLAIGAGQMSRVDAVKTAVLKAQAAAPDRNLLSGSAVASDAFFPFRDGLDAVVAAGATSVVQPGGSMRDAEVIAAADEHGIAMVFTGRRHFRH